MIRFFFSYEVDKSLVRVDANLQLLYVIELYADDSVFYYFSNRGGWPVEAEVFFLLGYGRREGDQNINIHIFYRAFDE